MKTVVRRLCWAALRDRDLTDGQLLERFIARREEAAFEALVQRHGPMVLGVCRRVLGNHHDAEDAFQATFLILARKAASLGSREAVGNYLYGVAYRTARRAHAMNVRRREKERRAVPSGPARSPDEAWQELRPILDAELNRLPDAYRLAVVLCDLEGRSRKEVAQQLRIPEGTLSSRLATARKRLAERLSRRGLALGGGIATLLAGRTAEAMPPPLVNATVRAGLHVGAGHAATAVVSGQVTALTEGVLTAMFFTKLRVATTILLVTAVLGAGVFLTGAAGQLEPRKEPATRTTSSGPERRLPARFLKSDEDHIGPIAWSPDGKMLAGATYGRIPEENGAVHVWDLKSGAVRHRLTDARGKFTPFDASVAFSPDGKLLAAAHTRIGPREARAEILLWEVESGKLKHALEHASVPMRCLAFSPDGKVVASGTSGKFGLVKLWDTETGKLLRTLEDADQMAVHMAYSTDGKRLAVIVQAEDRSQQIQVWDPAAGTLLHSLGPEDVVVSVAFTGDCKRLVALTYEGPRDEAKCSVKLWDVASGELKQTRVLKEESVTLDGYWGQLSPDGKLIAHVARIGDRPAVTLWDVRTGERRLSLEGHSAAEPHHFSFSRDGKELAASGGDQKVNVWEIGPRRSAVR
jgi:RNA polymerase sigma factor (sigma-70 family)